MSDLFGIGSAIGGIASGLGGLSQAVGGAINRLIVFAKDIIHKAIEIAYRFIKWYMDLLKEDPMTAMAIALVVGYWLSP